MIGFVSAGLLELPRAVAVIYGINIGTTMTAQLIAFDVQTLVYPVLFLGFLLDFAARRPRWQAVGEAVFSFGLLFEGIDILGRALQPLAGQAVFLDWMTRVKESPLLGILLGLSMTMVVQSSSATIALLQNVARQAGPDGIHSMLGLAGAVPVLLGDNIGTTVTALLACIGQGKDAARAALAHSCFNLSGSLLAAVLILVIACCNYTNMSLSRLLQQLRMIHVEKLMGSTLRNIRLQLFGDAFLTVVLAFLLSILLVNDCLAVFNGLLGSRLTMGFFFSSQMLPWLLVFILVMSVIPAWYISRRLSRLSFSQYRTLYGGRRKQRFVAVLVTVQFAISIGLLLATLVARNQMSLTERQASRYENCIEIGDAFGAPLAPFKAELEKRVRNIESMTLSKSSILNAWIRQLSIQTAGGEEVRTNLLTLEGDSTLLGTIRIEQLSGDRPDRLLDRQARPILVNESFVRLLIPAGTKFIGHSLREFDAEASDSLAVIAGVVRDFPVNSLEESVTPLIIKLLSTNDLQKGFYVQIRLRPENRAETLQQIEAVWNELHPGQPFQYTDMHQDFMKRNGKVLSLSRILTFYALIGLLLTGFGLFGIAWYATRQRIREISIRKVHGATRGQIIWLLNNPFCLYAAVAYVLAMPVAWWLMQRWLEQFAYRAPLSVGIFVWPLVVVWGVSALIVCLQGWMLSRVKPVEAMKNE